MDEEVLYYLAQNNASYKPFITTTSTIAEAVGSTQQTISRRLIELEEKGLIKRESTPKGVAVLLTKDAIKALKTRYEMLSSVFSPQAELTGKVESGLGEGAYYMKQEPYQMQFREKLGFFPFAGTLNIIVDISELRKFLITENAIRIDGFKAAERTFGGLWAYPVKLFGEKAAFVVPMRTTHPEDIIELISPDNLREKRHLKDGTSVTVGK